MGTKFWHCKMSSISGCRVARMGFLRPELNGFLGCFSVEKLATTLAIFKSGHFGHIAAAWFFRGLCYLASSRRMESICHNFQCAEKRQNNPWFSDGIGNDLELWKKGEVQFSTDRSYMNCQFYSQEFKLLQFTCCFSEKVLNGNFSWLPCKQTADNNSFKLGQAIFVLSFNCSINYEICFQK